MLVAGRVFPDILDVHMSDARARGSAPDIRFEPRNPAGLSDCENLHAAVEQIPDPAAHALAPGAIAHEIPKAHALDAPSDQISTRDRHQG